MNNTNIGTKIANIINKATLGLEERSEEIKLSLLSLLAGENIFIFGKSGMGRTTIAGRISELINESAFVEVVATDDFNEDQLLGPISEKNKQNDVHKRKIAGYLPGADVALVDAIFDMSPKAYPQFKQIISDGMFTNYGTLEYTYNQIIFGASTSFPKTDRDIEMLNNFGIRILLSDELNKNIVKAIVENKETTIDLSPQEKLTLDELDALHEVVKEIRIDQETLDFVFDLIEQLKSKLPSTFYISNKRITSILNLLKASAFVARRSKVEIHDLLLLPHMLWNNAEERMLVNDMFISRWADIIVARFGLRLTDVFETIAQCEYEFKQYIQPQSKNTIETLRNDKNELTTYKVFTYPSNTNAAQIALPVEIVNGEPTVNKNMIDLAKQGNLAYYTREDVNSNWEIVKNTKFKYEYKSGHYKKDEIELQSWVTETSKDTTVLKRIYEEVAKLSPIIGRIEGYKDELIKELQKHDAPLIGNLSETLNNIVYKLDEQIFQVIARKDILVTSIMTNGKGKIHIAKSKNRPNAFKNSFNNDYISATKELKITASAPTTQIKFTLQELNSKSVDEVIKIATDLGIQSPETKLKIHLIRDILHNNKE